MSISQQIGAARLIQPGVCTSASRPASPFEGQMIYETDTDLLKIWNGAVWRIIASSTIATGAVLQVKQTVVNTSSSTTSSTQTDISGMTVSITPQSSTSKFLIQASMTFGFDATADDTYAFLVRNGTNISVGSGAISANSSVYLRGPGNTLTVFPASISFLDSPATASALTYKMQWATRVGTIYFNRRGADTNFITSSSITVSEIAA